MAAKTTSTVDVLWEVLLVLFLLLHLSHHHHYPYHLIHFVLLPLSSAFVSVVSSAAALFSPPCRLVSAVSACATARNKIVVAFLARRNIHISKPQRGLSVVISLTADGLVSAIAITVAVSASLCQAAF
jgi:hypothetical protein